MTYVHGHPRDAGWVVAHYRRPQAPEGGQLALPLPEPREPAAEPAEQDRDSRFGSTPARS